MGLRGGLEPTRRGETILLRRRSSSMSSLSFIVFTTWALARAEFPLRCTVKGQVVRAPHVTVRVARPFRYVGGQRFLLGDTADAEQHLFVVADANREVSELLWLQFEEYVPSVARAYNYADDPAVSSHGMKFFTNVRRYATPPQSGSDRDRAFKLLSSAGYSLNKIANRVRLVHIPSEDHRSEVMIIYATRARERDLTPEEAKSAIQKALSLISVSRH